MVVVFIIHGFESKFCVMFMRERALRYFANVQGITRLRRSRTLLNSWFCVILLKHLDAHCILEKGTNRQVF